jgi:drug/metabolite transporter (DMT)-like permease
MPDVDARRANANGRKRERAGFLAAVAFVCAASVRDVFLGDLFQRLSPLAVAIVAFASCSLIFLLIALAKDRRALRDALRRPRRLVWINATSALAWISFFYGLRMLEPMLVQILFAGVGPLSVAWIDRLLTRRSPAVPLSRVERPLHLGLFAALGTAAAVALGGLSGVGPQPFGAALVGVGLALAAGVAISVNTVLCRELNDDGIAPLTLVSLRFVGATVAAGALGFVSGEDFSLLFEVSALALVVGPALVLVVFPIYVNQVAIALASPLTVRVVLAGAPALVFVLQLLDGRLSPSPYSFGAAVLYGVFAAGSVFARQRAIRATQPA